MIAASKTSVHIAGFWFYITWENDEVGYDQRGNKWLDKTAPHPENEEIANICLDFYNEIKKQSNETKTN